MTSPSSRPSNPAPYFVRPKFVVVHDNNVTPEPAIASDDHRKILSAALLIAMSETGATQADVAKWCRVTERTVRSWLNDPDSPGVSVRCVMKSKRLRLPFARALVSLLLNERPNR
jgi:hypothetical protein